MTSEVQQSEPLSVFPPPELGKVGVWSGALDSLSVPDLARAAVELEELGFGALWFAEGHVRDSFVKASLILSSTSTLVAATGIASIWTRHPRVTQASNAALEDAYPGRFLLGLGASHAHIVENVLGRNYERPLEAMRTHLDGIDEAARSAGRVARPARVLAALGPKMLELAAERAEGAHPYLVTPAHTAIAREALGPDRLLCVEQAVVVTTDRELALERARRHLAIYLGAPNYTNNWQRLGFSEEDLKDGGSKRLLDALVVSGTATAIRARVTDHLDAGADHVCVQVLGESRGDVGAEQWRELGPALHL